MEWELHIYNNERGSVSCPHITSKVIFLACSIFEPPGKKHGQQQHMKTKRCLYYSNQGDEKLPIFSLKDKRMPRGLAVLNVSMVRLYLMYIDYF